MPEETKTIRFWKFSEILLAALGVGLGVSTSLLWSQYGLSRPMRPHPDAGRVYALAFHSATVYLTKGEHLWLYSLMWVSGMYFFIAFCIDRFVNPYRR